jgi:hypothetical protein
VRAFSFLENTMGLAEQWLLEQQRCDDEADKHEHQLSIRADNYRAEFDKLIAARNIDAETGMKYMPRLIDVMGEATGLTDDGIFRSMMQALVHCAAKGQIEAVEAMDRVKQFFVEQMTRDA